MKIMETEGQTSTYKEILVETFLIIKLPNFALFGSCLFIFSCWQLMFLFSGTFHVNRMISMTWKSNKRIEISLLDEEIVVQLVNSHSHSKENAEAMKKEVLRLLNYVLFSYSVKDKFGNSQCCTVWSYKCKFKIQYGTVQVSVYSDHVKGLQFVTWEGHAFL